MPIHIPQHTTEVIHIPHHYDHHIPIHTHGGGCCLGGHGNYGNHVRYHTSYASASEPFPEHIESFPSHRIQQRHVSAVYPSTQAYGMPSQRYQGVASYSQPTYHQYRSPQPQQQLNQPRTSPPPPTGSERMEAGASNIEYDKVTVIRGNVEGMEDMEQERGGMFVVG